MNEQATHDGDLGHNASVWYHEEPYETTTGEPFEVSGIRISDRMRSVFLCPQEALSLLAWLTQERPLLEQLAKEAAGASSS